PFSIAKLSRASVLMTIERRNLGRWFGIGVVLGPIALGVGLEFGALGIVDLCFLFAVPGEHLLHVAVAAFFCEHPRAVHQQLLGFHEILAVETPDARMYVGVHPDRVAWTGLHAQAAVDAAQRVDFVADRELFDLWIGRLAGLYVYALRRTGCRAQVAGGT